MKTAIWITSGALLLLPSAESAATQYTSPITTSTPLVAGDSVLVTSGNTSALRAGLNDPALNIVGGGVDLENSSSGGGAVIELSNRLSNSLGVGSVVTRSGTALNPDSIRLSGSSLSAEQLTLTGGTVTLNAGSAVDFKNSSLTSSNNYLLRGQTDGSINLTDTEITHASSAAGSKTIDNLGGGSMSLNNVQVTSSAYEVIALDRGTHTATFNDLVIRHATSVSGGSAVWMYGDAVVTGQNLDIQSNMRSLYVGGGVSATFTGNNKIYSQSGSAIAVHSETGAVSKDAHLDLSNATVAADRSHALLVQGPRATAWVKDSTLIGPWSLYALNGSQATVENSVLQMVNSSTTPTYAVLAYDGAQVDLRGSNTVSAVGTNLAILASDNGQVNATGQLVSTGRIQAQNNSSIDLALNNSLLAGVIVADAASQVNWTDQGSTWNVWGNSNLNNLSLGQGSVINTQGVANDVTLTFANLVSTEVGSSAPLFQLKANVQTLTADFVKVTNSSSGNFWVDIPNNAAEVNDGTQVLDIIETPDGLASFASTRLIEKGGYYYTVARSANDPATWQLVPTVGPPENTPGGDPEITSTGRGGANIALASHLMNYASQQSLADRISSVRLHPQEQGGWMRAYHGKVDLKADRVKGSDLTYTGLQFGYDRVFQRASDGYWLVGGMLEYLKGTQRYEAGENGLNAYSAGLYLSKFYDNGLYFDGLLKYSMLRNRVDSIDTQNVAVTGRDNTQALSLSAEVGKTIPFGQTSAGTFFIQPQLQFTASQIASHNFKHSNGLEVKAKSETSLLARAGVNVGYQFAEHPSTVYLKLDWLKEFDGDVGFTLNGSAEHIKLQGNWLEVGVGAQTAVTDRQKIFFEAKASNNSQFRERKFNLGYRWDF